MEQNDPTISADELNAVLGELLENREAVVEIAVTMDRPDLLELRNATIAAARGALERPGLAGVVRFTCCLARERGALLRVDRGGEEGEDDEGA